MPANPLFSVFCCISFVVFAVFVAAAVLRKLIRQMRNEAWSEPKPKPKPKLKPKPRAGAGV